MNDSLKKEEGPDEGYDPGRLFKVLFALMLAVFVYQEFDDPSLFDKSFEIWFRIPDFFINVFFYIGFYGLVWGRQLFSRKFWQVFLVLMVVRDLYALSFFVEVAFAMPELALYGILIVPVILFYWYMIYRYQELFKFFTSRHKKQGQNLQT